MSDRESIRWQKRQERVCPLNNGPLRSLHVIAGLDPAHGGPSYTVPRLCQALAMAGAEARLLSVAGADGCEIALDTMVSVAFPGTGRAYPWCATCAARRVSRTRCTNSRRKLM